MSYKRKETIGDAILFLGDCLSVMGDFPDCLRVDAVITDPPYGVNLGAKANNQKFDRQQYTKFDDTPENVERICVPAVSAALAIAERGAVTPGVKNMWLYEKPQHVGSFYYPAASGCNSWGFSNWQPIFYYGKDPYGGKGSLHDSKESTEATKEKLHPCAKPIGQMEWLVNRASLKGQTVLDPFCGSGTTGVACANLGRKFIGIEIEEKYFDIACERIEAAYAQGRLFA